MQMHSLGTHRTTNHYDKELDMQVITYWSTPVVKFDSQKIILNTGGWKTTTTKARMNQASNQYNLGYQVAQKAFKWFVIFKGKKIEFTGDTITLER